MVGEGDGDPPMVAAADVGAHSGRPNVPSCAGLTRVPSAFAWSQATGRTARQRLYFAFASNVVRTPRGLRTGPANRLAFMHDPGVGPEGAFVDKGGG